MGTTDLERLRIEDLSLEERVGQLFLVGFDGANISEHVRTLVEERGVGNLILFERNAGSPKENAAFCRSLQALARKRARPPLLIAADQEGGWVVRLVEGNTRFPGSMAQGATRSIELAEQTAACLARELLAQGVNLNLAPVLDVNSNPENPIIGLRSFGASPEIVSEMGVAAIRGFQSSGVAACAKHFPGHGDTHVDSHLDLPVIAHPRERLDAIELVPFQRAIAAGVWCIMTAHILFRGVVGEGETPGTLSPEVTTRLLREELGFGGVIVTDCMEMHAVAKRYSFAETAVRALSAGADMVTISHTPKSQIEAIDGVLSAVSSGRISIERIDEACRRVMALKERVFTYNGPKLTPGEVGGPAHQVVAQSVANAAITLVRDPARRVPLSTAHEVLVLDITSEGRWRGPSGTPAGTVLDAELHSMGYRVTHLDQREKRTLELDVVERIAASLDRGAQPIIVLHRVVPEMIEKLVEALPEPSGVCMISVGDPYAFDKVPGSWSVLLTYGQEPALLHAAAQALSGDLKPQGRLPV